ncbi:MAG: hypothetical protein ABSA13_17515 [Beijerinckiaceae bacterium]|jgi:hypothetical protein
MSDPRLKQLAWRISDVTYGEGAGATSLAHMFTEEIDKDERTPFVQLPTKSGRWTNADCGHIDAATTRFMSPGKSSTSGEDCVAKATAQGSNLFVLELICTNHDGNSETHQYQVKVHSNGSMTWLFRGKDGIKDPMKLKYCAARYVKSLRSAPPSERYYVFEYTCESVFGNRVAVARNSTPANSLF